MTIKTALELLELKPGSTPKKLKSAYRKKAMLTHPDKGGKQEMFIAIKTAYDFLVKSGTGSKTEYTLANFRADIRRVRGFGAAISIQKMQIQKIYDHGKAAGLNHVAMTAELLCEYEQYLEKKRYTQEVRFRTHYNGIWTGARVQTTTGGFCGICTSA